MQEQAGVVVYNQSNTRVSSTKYHWHSLYTYSIDSIHKYFIQQSDCSITTVFVKHKCNVFLSLHFIQ